MSNARPSTSSRTRRGRIVVVSSGDGTRELAAALRRKFINVTEVATAFDAVDECQKAAAREPIAAVMLSPECEHYDPARFADAFERVDPSVPLILAVTAAEDELTADAAVELFECSVRIPPRDEELARVLDDLGLLEPSAATRQTIPPLEREPPEILIDATIERAQESARQIAHNTHETPAAKHASISSSAPSTPASVAHPTSPSPLTPTRTASRPMFQMPAPSKRANDHATDAPPSDLDLVRAVMTGHDALGAAMRVLRHGIGSTDVRFVPETRPGEEAAIEPDRRGLLQIPVARSDGRLYGVLLSRTIDETCLRAWATWLSAWLDLDESHQELRRLTWADELTGAGNRRAFDKLLFETIKSAQQGWRYFGLMLFDIDDFKRYNDHHGHDVGDEVLREIVVLLHACIRRGDRCFRIGGDEFAVLFCDPDGPRRGGTLDRDAAAMIAKRFQRAVEELNLSHIGLAGPGTVSVSTGFAAFPWHGLDPVALYRAADGFCLESKRAGKNRITFGPGMGAPEETPT